MVGGVQAETTEELDARLSAYKRDGYTIWRGLYSQATMDRWKAEQSRLQAESASLPGAAGAETTWFGNMLERSPQLMWEAVSNPTVLDFAETVVGPFVQLDNLTLAAFLPMDEENREKARGTASGYHRDRWGRMPSGNYERPLAFNAITYLQDLTDDNGPLRIIPGSHLRPVELGPEDGSRPHPDEEVLYLKAGDTIMTHTGLLHSGTPNLSDDKRYFFSVYYNISWLKHTDSFDGPNCAQLKSWARANVDHRALRLLGEDDHLQARANSGFQRPDEERWKQWASDDAEVKAKTAAARL